MTGREACSCSLVPEGILDLGAGLLDIAFGPAAAAFGVDARAAGGSAGDFPGAALQDFKLMRELAILMAVLPFMAIVRRRSLRRGGRARN